jgi:rSAM/selenodomain-associated transferase 2
MLSIIIPTLNAEQELAQTLAVLQSYRDDLGFEIIVTDGGSTDNTALVAEQACVIFLQGQRGRGTQMAEATEDASGDWFLFLHADTCPQPGWVEAVRAFMDDPLNIRNVGYFRFALDDESPAAKRLERVVHWRCRVLRLPYGDQGLLISRTYYEEIGGFKAIPLMEDVELIRHVPRSRRKMLPATAVTSAAKYRRDGFLARPLRNMLCLGLFAVGLPPRYIISLYR